METILSALCLFAALGCFLRCTFIYENQAGRWISAGLAFGITARLIVLFL